LYETQPWPDYYEEYEDDDFEDEEAFEFEARWRGPGDLEVLISREPAIPLQSLPDFTLPVGIAAVIFVLFVLTRGSAPAKIVTPVIEVAVAGNMILEEPPAQAQAQALVPAPDPEVFAAPYADYVVTQGIHGASYGQMAIDLAAGKGAPVLSPINGVISENLVDQYGNPTLVIENDRYVVKLLHGNFSVLVGDTVVIGQQVGTESNRGYTTDMRGVPCAGRTDYCGYHTHLNVFDKALNSNVNPLDLIRP
jgi:murein DD-endopeptidase MepM/ murein hydrolase activator NlpD